MPVFAKKIANFSQLTLSLCLIEGHSAEGSTYTCKMCRQIFQRFSKFEWHSCDPNCIKTHQDMFSCKLCQKNFRRFGTYEGHPCRVKAKKDRDEEGYGWFIFALPLKKTYLTWVVHGIQQVIPQLQIHEILLFHSCT